MYNAQITKDRIKSLCKERNIKSEVMLADCNLGVNAIRQISDTKGMTSFSLAKIADYLDCSVDYLLGRAEKPNVTYTNVNSSNIVNGSNGDNSPLTVQNDDATEMEKEISSILAGMSYRERTELMLMIYKFADEHKK